MLKIKIKKILLTLIGATLLATVFSASTLTTSAKYNPVTRKICSLAVAPYNKASSPTLGLVADQYLNYLSNETCNKFVKLYGNAYSPQPPKTENNPVKPGAEDKNVPIIRHDHSYYNDTIHDENFYYKAFIDRFEITLQSDTFNNVNLNEVKCQTPYPTGYDTSKIAPLEDCSGNVDDLWGGTVLSKKTVGNKIVITWDFAQVPNNGKFTGRPQVWADNGKDFDKGDFTDENKRKLAFNVHLPSKDNNEQIWSATTTSRVLAADLAINKANYAAHKNDSCKNNDVNDAGSGWCYIDPKDNEPTKNFATETVFTTENKTFYWFDIGSVATVWQKKIQPKIQPNICKEVKVSLDPKTITINNKTAYHINIDKITFDPKNEIPEGAKLKLTSTDDSKGEFWILSPLAGVEEMPSPYVKIGTGTATTYPTNTKIYYIGTKPTKVKVELIDIPASQLGTTCYGYVFIPIKEKECKNILVDHPEKIYEGTVSVFKAKALDTDYNDFPGKIKYWVEPGYGEFYTIKPKNIPLNTSKQVLEATPSSATSPLPGYTYIPDYIYNPANAIDPNIIIAGNSANTITDSVINITTALGTGDFGIENLSANLPNPAQIQNFANLNLIEIPSWMDTGLKLNINPIDPTPIDSQKGGDQLFNTKSGQISLLALNLGDFDIQPAITPDFTLEDLTKPSILDKPYLFNSLFESITVDPDTTVYFWAKKQGKNKVHVQTINSNVKECRRDFDIEPKPQLLCKELDLVTNTKSDLVTGQPALININPKDTAGKKLPPTTKFKLITTTDGKFQNGAGKDLGNTALLSDFPIYLKNATKAGSVTVEMDKTDPAYAAVCAAVVKVKVSPQNQCTALSYTLVEYGGTDKPNLEKGKMYKVSAKLTTTIPNENTITYSINNNYGVFVKGDGIAVQAAIKTTVSSLNPINLTTLTQAFGANSVASQLTVAENTTVILITFSDPANSLTSLTALKIQGSGYSDPCIKSVPFIPTETKECKKITSITTPSGSQFDPNMTDSSNPPKNEVIFNINNPADYQDFLNQSDSNKIKVTLGYTGNASNPPAITYMNGTPSIDGTLIFTKAGPFAFKYFKNGYNELNDKLTLTVDAIKPDGNLVPACHLLIEKNPPTTTKECKSLSIDTPDSSDLDDWEEAEGKFEIDVDAPGYNENDLWYNWKVTEGDGKWQNSDDEISEKGAFTQTLKDFEEGTEVKVWASTSKSGPILDSCSDTITAEEAKKEKGPKIAKYAYPKNQINKADDILNINGNTDYITYMLIFDVNDINIESVRLWDDKLNNGDINSPGSPPDGKLQFAGMKIDVLKKNGEGKTLFKTKGYELDSNKPGTSDEFNDNNFKDDYNYEKNECTDKNTSICFDTKATDIKKTFKNGKKITFKNLNKGNVDKIIIKYQMDYINPLTDLKCQELTICGEQFENKASYETTTDNKDYDGSAGTKVIVICPYILTRQGGDVFFHDVIDTGVDVAQCSEVKSCDGPCITPEPPEKQKQIKTGAGDIPDEIKLELPSHDVCRYSNLGNNLEGYNNVLKNFSSTICELRADVSKAWTKKNINDSIAANVKRIARWEENLTKSSISNMTDLTDLSNQTSGVFVRKSGDLKIGNLSEYVINKNGSVPAAQTYIVIGHDLYINSDIKYAQLSLQDFTNNKNIPSAAFIVIDGDIIIDRNVKQIDGILMAVDLDGDDTDGKVKSNGYTNENTLTINGNLIGDVYDLFKNRQAVGDPRKDQGSVTIRYDERILLNTPPGISELINVQQAIVPN